MTDPNRPPSEPKPGPADPAPAAARDPIAERAAGESAGVESPSGGAAGDPDALDQSVGRGDSGQGNARTRDGVI